MDKLLKHVWVSGGKWSLDVREHRSLGILKTHGSESRGQEEAACMRVFWPTRPLQ